MFFESIRTSTWATILVFMAVMVARKDWAVMVACMAWLWGFEAAYQITSYVMGTNALPGDLWWFTAFGAASILLAARFRVPVSWPWIGCAAAIWLVWLLFGFHANLETGRLETGAPFSVWYEVLNTTAKTALAAAFLLPYARQPRTVQAR